MLRLLFTTEDNSKQLTVITDGIDSQLNVFVTEDVVGDIDYFKSLGIVVEPGHTYNIGKFKEWAFDAKLILISYPEGLNEKSVILQDIQEDWRYTFETSTPELNFPATGGNEEYVITSGKQLYINGEAQGEIEPVELTVVVNGSGFAAQADTTVSATQNPTEAERRGTLVATQKESNKQINIVLIQAASVITYEYTLTATPTSLSFNPSGQTLPLTITSQKQKKINGTNEGAAVNVNYTTNVSGTGFMKVDNSHIAATENTGDTARSGTAKIVQNESSKEVSISLTQPKAVVSYNYQLTVDPMQLNFVAEGESKIFAVTSNKTKTVNGKEEGLPISVAYTTTVTGEGFSKGDSEYSVVAAANTTSSERTGIAKVTASEGGKSIDVDLTQAAGTV